MKTTQSFRSPFLRSWLLWTAGFVALPLAGFAGSAVVDRVDNPAAALAGGAIAGLIIGIGQTLASNHRLQARKWIPASTLGMSAGLLFGAIMVSYRTSLGDLALMGAVNGLVLGAAQAFALPRGVSLRWVWSAAIPVLWSLGWIVTTLLLIRVDEQYIVFGASGALVFAALSGLLLHRILPNRQETGPRPVQTVKASTA